MQNAADTNRRGPLIIVLVIAVLVMGAVLLLRHGGSSKHAAATSTPPTLKGHHPTPRRKPTLPPGTTAEIAYARALSPYVSRAASLFDRIYQGAAGASFSRMGADCYGHESQVQTLHAQMDDVPQNQPLGTPSATLQSRQSRIMGFMLGALEECRMAAENSDSIAASNAIGDLGSARSRIHRLARDLARVQRGH